jgi:alpha-beta hydrolase superfamily lysophospholipase
MFLRVLAALVALAIGAIAVLSYVLAGMLIYFRKPKSEWDVPRPPVCAEWMVGKAFADLSSPEKAATKTPIDIGCEDTLKLPKEDFEVKSNSGFKIHYAVYPNETKDPKAPLFVHVHGISGNYAHGARYFKAAGRMGFQLVALELSNHGLSEKNGKGAAYGCREDADIYAVVEDLRRRMPNRLIYIHATSMGTMALANALPLFSSAEASEDIAAMSMENPIPSVHDVVLNTPQRPPLPSAFLEMGIWVAGLRAGFNFETCRPVDSLQYANVPLLIQFSKKDDLVTYSMVQEFMKAIPADVKSRLELYDEGSHSAVWNADPERYEKETVENFRLGLEQFEDVEL